MSLYVHELISRGGIPRTTRRWLVTAKHSLLLVDSAHGQVTFHERPGLSLPGLHSITKEMSRLLHDCHSTFLPARDQYGSPARPAGVDPCGMGKHATAAALSRPYGHNDPNQGAKKVLKICYEVVLLQPSSPALVYLEHSAKLLDL